MIGSVLKHLANAWACNFRSPLAVVPVSARDFRCTSPRAPNNAVSGLSFEAYCHPRRQDNAHHSLPQMERRLKNQEEIPTQLEGQRIVFFHPDLGIGGAERLVVDAAVGLQNLGNKVTIFTSYRDLNHCFDEARDGTLDVRVRGGWLFPATLLGRFKILCSILRQVHLILAITWSGELVKLRPTAFFLDQLSAGVPFLRWFWEDQKILFYCHFPDLLLAQGRKRWHRKIWRITFDWWEGWGIRGADRVIVNSGFTKGVAETVWPGLGGERGVGVVYPCVDTSEPYQNTADGQDHGQALWKGQKVLLSINRFERKKNIGLAIKAFAGLKSKEREVVRLVIAGTALISRGHLHFHERTLTPEKVATTPGKRRT